MGSAALSAGRWDLPGIAPSHIDVDTFHQILHAPSPCNTAESHDAVQVITPKNHDDDEGERRKVLPARLQRSRCPAIAVNEQSLLCHIRFPDPSASAATQVGEVAEVAGPLFGKIDIIRIIRIWPSVNWLGCYDNMSDRNCWCCLTRSTTTRMDL